MQAPTQTLPAGPGRPGPARPDTGRLVQRLTAAMIAVLVIGPILPIVYQSVIAQPLYSPDISFDASAYVRLLTETGFLKAALNSAWFGVLSTLFAILAGGLIAVLTARVRVPGSALLGMTMLVPLYISPLVMSFGWVILYGPVGYFHLLAKAAVPGLDWNLYSVPGMAVVSGIAYAPLAYLYCASALRSADPSLEDAARTCGCGSLRVLTGVTLPLMRPPVLYAALLIFSSAIEQLSIPLILGKPAGIDMFASFLFDIGLGQTNPDYPVLGAASVLLLVIGICLVLLQMRLLRNSQRFISVGGKALRHKPLDVGWLRLPLGLLALAIVVLGILAPLAALALRSVTSILSPLLSPLKVLTLDNFRMIFSQPSYVDAIANSLVLALVGAAVTCVLALVAVLVSQRSPFRFRRGVQILALVPQAVPAILLGLGFFWFFALVTPLGWMRGTLLALIVTFACRTLPVAYAAIAPGASQISRDLDNAARTMGASWLHTLTRIMLPLFLPGAFAAFILVFVQMMKELSSAIFLVTADTQLISTTVLQLWLNGEAGAVAAMSLIEVALTILVVLVLGRIMKVKAHG
ncbi:ABC transporter permease subunit [Pseudooceanicola sp. GBMRC 2024]|uniref:ABC transporter permease subunit n=1 Tax=Pseudooceanicola albus TaxID=2692189 RepID=A0A6L7G5J8_9RHOB|nr:iron ABC transporter permease [Pseudooceanicola albus]MXN17933.1 ABC transporter permease subunit [Pseudooceanicola albus]